MIPLHDDNPTHSRPVLTYLLVAINVLIFLLQISVGEALTLRFALFPGAVTEGRPVVVRGLRPETLDPAWLTIFTSMFLHGSWLHLLGNMWYLWIFGNNVEDTLGHARFLIFYFFGGLMAALAHILTEPTSMVPTVGASGAIAAVLGGYLVCYPRARVTVLVPIFFFLHIVVLPASVVLGFWFFLQLVSGLMGLGMESERGGVAFMAHIGGFVAGYVVMRLIGGRRREPPRTPRPRFID